MPLPGLSVSQVAQAYGIAALMSTLASRKVQ